MDADEAPEAEDVFKGLTPGEQSAVLDHRESLSAEKGYDVGLEHALTDWLDNHALAWRTERQAEMLGLERQEILRHKWIESEKAERDLGGEAVLDWIQNHAANWRDCYERDS